MNFLKWLHEGHDCCNCPASWEEWSAYHEDCDCGCHIKGYDYDEKPCWLPHFICRLLMRRIRYYWNHEYDGIGEFYEELEQTDRKCKTSILEMLDGKVICIKYDDGTLHECNTEMIIEHEAWRVRDALEPEYQRPPTIPQRWMSLLHDTLMVIPNKIKPFVCK